MWFRDKTISLMKKEEINSWRNCERVKNQSLRVAEENKRIRTDKCPWVLLSGGSSPGLFLLSILFPITIRPSPTHFTQELSRASRIPDSSDGRSAHLGWRPRVQFLDWDILEEGSQQPTLWYSPGKILVKLGICDCPIVTESDRHRASTWHYKDKTANRSEQGFLICSVPLKYYTSIISVKYLQKYRSRISDNIAIYYNLDEIYNHVTVYPYVGLHADLR